ncbi:hypothetical protein PIB30_090167 [Stylosanthes scabra]|uniref:Uncharacterized protein n=1 Tax=Stylosanthes scabra TaxID=79078 RepID=A0ABU6TUT0_9FABA|nr:hypothetical protein [Stylosanthes scabra]
MHALHANPPHVPLPPHSPTFLASPKRGWKRGHLPTSFSMHHLPPDKTVRVKKISSKGGKVLKRDNKLDHTSTPSKSQAKPTLQASTVGPRFLPSPNVTQGKASSPWSRFCHVFASPKRDSNMTIPQAPQALPSFKQGHVWTKSQT